MKINYRSKWKAKPNKGQLVRMRKLNKIVIHHAAGYDDDKGKVTIQRIQEIQRLHQGPKKDWNDIGYHFLIDSVGNIYQGRDFYDKSTDISSIPEFIHGAHVKHANSDKIGICFLGCYHPPAGIDCKKILSQLSLASLIELCVFICKNYNLKSDDIGMHKDYRDTDCPGDNIANIILNIRADVQAAMLVS